LNANGCAAGFGPAVTGIAALTLSAASGAIWRTSSGGADRSGDDQPEHTKAERFARIGAPQRLRARSQPRGMSAKPRERGRKGQRLGHHFLI
jgi:hypothetical protein